MLGEVIPAIIQKILKDKILLGLVIVGVLSLLIGGMSISDYKGDDKKEAPGGQAPGAQAAAPGAAPAAGGIQPPLAAEFVKWWINGAMDYNAQTAKDSHNQALAWMTADAAQSFQNTFWSPQIAESVSTGRLVAAFQPTGVQAEAVNPDGTVVVGVSGTFVVQSNGQPISQQFAADFLVKQDQDGLRVAGLYNKSNVVPGATIY